MSRGPGKLQRAILAALQERSKRKAPRTYDGKDFYFAGDLVYWVLYPDEYWPPTPTHSQFVSMYRAIHLLERRGLVETRMGNSGLCADMRRALCVRLADKCLLSCNSAQK